MDNKLLFGVYPIRVGGFIDKSLLTPVKISIIYRESYLSREDKFLRQIHEDPYYKDILDRGDIHIIRTGKIDDMFDTLKSPNLFFGGTKSKGLVTLGAEKYLIMDIFN